MNQFLGTIIIVGMWVFLYYIHVKRRAGKRKNVMSKQAMQDRDRVAKGEAVNAVTDKAEAAKTQAAGAGGEGSSSSAVEEWPGDAVLRAVNPADQSRDPQPSTDETPLRHSAVAATMLPSGTEYHGPDFPAEDRFYLFRVSEKKSVITPEHVCLTEDVSVSIDPKDGQLYLHTDSYYNDPRMTGRDRFEKVSYDKLKALIASSLDPRAGFFNDMNAKNWRDYVGRRYRQDREQKRRPAQIKPSDLLESPKSIEAFYLFYIPMARISYFRKVDDNWRLFHFNTMQYQRFEKSVYASIFESHGEDAVNELKQTASAGDCWYERILTPLEVRYFLSQLQLKGLYEKTRGEQMPEFQPKYLSLSSHTKENVNRFHNVQAWYVLDGKRYYLQDFATDVIDRPGFDSILEWICEKMIFGCELSASPTKPYTVQKTQKEANRTKTDGKMSCLLSSCYDGFYTYEYRSDVCIHIKHHIQDQMGSDINEYYVYSIEELNGLGQNEFIKAYPQRFGCTPLAIEQSRRLIEWLRGIGVHFAPDSAVSTCGSSPVPQTRNASGNKEALTSPEKRSLPKERERYTVHNQWGTRYIVLAQVPYGSVKFDVDTCEAYISVGTDRMNAGGFTLQFDKRGTITVGDVLSKANPAIVECYGRGFEPEELSDNTVIWPFSDQDICKCETKKGDSSSIMRCPEGQGDQAATSPTLGSLGKDLYVGNTTLRIGPTLGYLGKDSRESIKRITDKNGIRQCVRCFSNLKSNDEEDILLWIKREGFSIPYICVKECHDPGEEDRKSSFATSDNLDEILRLIHNTYGEWHMTAKYGDATVEIHKLYPNIEHGLSFAYPEALDTLIRPAFERFRKAFCYPTIRLSESEQGEKKPPVRQVPVVLSAQASPGNASPKQNDDHRVLFTTVAGREGDVADCVVRYSQMEAQVAHKLAGKQSSLAACNIPRVSLMPFCKELAQLGASVYLELKNPYHQRLFIYEKNVPINAAYLFDPCANVFYRPEREKGIVRVAQSEMSLCYYIVEPDTLCLFGSGDFSSFEHFSPETSGYPEYPWQHSGHEWDFYTTVLRFSASVEMNHIWSPRHSIEIIDWPSKSFLEVVTPVDKARAPLPSTEEILRRLHAPSTMQEKKAPVKTEKESSVLQAQTIQRSETQKKSGKSDAKNAVQIIADRLKDDMLEIPVETLFSLGGFGYTLNNQNCVFYHPASVQEDKAWMYMKSKWRKSLFNCVVMTNQSDDWAREVSKRLNKQLRDRRIIFLRPVEIDGSVDLSALDFEQPKVIARWYAPLEKKYYQCVIKWNGYSHDGSEDYYSLMLYVAE